MSQLSLARWLKTVVLIFGLLAAVFAFGMTPILAQNFQQLYPNFAGASVFYLLRFWLLIPAFLVAALSFWKICSNIAADNSFCAQNAVMCTRLSFCAAVDSVLAFLFLILTALLGVLRTGYLLASVLLILFGFAITVAAALLSHLVEKAAKLKEENDLTI